MSEAFDPYYTWLGIPPEEQPPDHYRLLGLRTCEPNPDVISNAADRQMLMLRTFQAGPRSKESQKILNQISAAKVCLLDPNKKAAYDRQLGAAAKVAGDSMPAARAAAKPAARRKNPEPAVATPVPQIVVTSDTRPTIDRPAPQRPAWQNPVVVGSAIAAVLALIIISAITLAVSSNKPGPPVAPPDQASTDSPTVLANVEPQQVATSDTPVVNADQPANSIRTNPSTPPPNVEPAPSPPAILPAEVGPQPPTGQRPVTITAVNEEQSNKPVDLLALVDTERDVKRGRFIRRENGLISVAGTMHIPYRLPDEYVLTAEVTRLQENDALMIGQVIGGRTCMHMIDGFMSDGTLCGLELVDNQRLPENPTRRAGQLLTEDEPATIVYTVRQNQLTVTVDGKTVTHWDGDPHRLRWYSFFKEPTDRNLFIGSWASVYRFSKLELVPLGGEAAATPVASAVPGELAEPVQRLAVPDGEKQKVVLGQVKEIFKDEYQAATTADGRMALVEKLIEQSGEAGLDAAAKFVLLSETFKYAAEAVQPDRAFQAADQLGRQFDIDPLEWKIKAVSDMDKAAWDADSRKRVATAAMAVSRQCLLDDRAPTAEKLSELAEDAATRSRDGELRIKTRTWNADVRQFVKQWNLADEAKKVLATTPNDAEANTQLGKFLCLTMNDWEKGLPHLVKTDRANMRQLAELELAAPQAATGKVELADAWWEAAKSAVSDEKDAYQRRARHWYQAALTELSGLQKIKVEKRLEALADVDEPLLVARSEVAPQPVAPAPQRPQPAGPEVGAALKSIIIERRQELSWQDRNHVTIDISPDGRKVAVKPDGWLVCWDIGTGKIIRSIELPNNGYHGVAFSADSSQVGCPTSRGTFAFFDLRTGAMTRQFDRGPVATFSKNGRIMATVSRTEPTIEILDTQNGRMQQLRGYAKAPGNLTLTADGRKLLSGGWDLPTFLWDVATGNQSPVGNNASALAFSPDGDLFAVAGGNSAIKLGKTATGMTIRELNGHARTPSSLHFSPRGQLLASVEFTNEDSVIKIWNVQTGECLATVNNPESLRYAAFAADDILVTGAQSRKVVLWNLKPNKAAPPPQRPQPPVAPRIAPPLNRQPGQDDPDRAAARWVLSIKDSGRPFFLTAVSLTMRGTNVYRERIGTLADLPEERFDVNAILIRNGDITDDDLRFFAGLRRLKSVTLQDTPISDQGLQHLKNCPLSSLTVCGDVTDNGVKFITENFQLSNFQLDNTQITDAGLAHLRNYKQLYTLALRRTKITDAGLTQLTDLQGLAYLWVDDTNITDTGVKHLAQLQNLKTLSLVRTKITLDGLRPLAALPKLESLWLEGTLSLAEVEPIRPMFPNVEFPNLR
jgi:WD40 repeat protein